MFVLAHLSDPHLGPLPWPSPSELAGKRLLGFINWRRKRARIHCPDILETLRRDLCSQAPDHIAVTGDLVNVASRREFPAALAWLARLGSPDAVTLVPGNHDAYVASAMPLIAEHWRAYMRGDDAANGMAQPIFPFVRRRGPIALVGVSSALPTPWFMATGLLGGEQIARLADILMRLRHERLFRVVLVHHPPVSHRRHKRLIDGAEFRAALARAGAELVLHGHDHVHSLTWLDGPRGPIPAVGVPSASAAPGSGSPPAAYNLYHIGGVPGDWTCEAVSRGCVPDGSMSELRRCTLSPAPAGNRGA